MKSLDTKLHRILRDPSCSDFILADAKDGDMAYGVVGLGPRADGKPRTVEDYRDEIRRNVSQGLVDIMLMSASSVDALAIRERLFADSHITPACRANDTTDIHLAKGGVYPALPSRPFRSTTLDHVMYGRLLSDDERENATMVGADLGLYSITFNNDLERDLDAIEQYRSFRIEAERWGFRHFLEVFNPNACEDHCPEDVGRYVSDLIVRTLAGVVSASRPAFLKVAYHGPQAMEQLAGYDRGMIVGIMGGSSGTTFDAFHQLWEARKYGARAALYGRMINNSEDQRAMIEHLRWIADGQINDPVDAVRSYHSTLEKRGIKPFRTLADDLQATLRGAAYSEAESGAAPRKVNTAVINGGRTSQIREQDGSSGIDFAAMSADEKRAWNQQKWNRVLD